MTLWPDRISRLQRSLELALNQEWPQLIHVGHQVRILQPIPIRSNPERPEPLPVVAPVATDGGENRFNLAPIHIEVIRVVDSTGETFFEDFVPLSLTPEEILRFYLRSEPRLQKFLQWLGCSWEEVLPQTDVQQNHLLGMLRELLEWAALLNLASRPPSKLLLRDGLFRSILLIDRLFQPLRHRLDEVTWKNGHLLVEIAKRSKVISYLSVALGLDERFAEGRAAYVEIPPDLEREAAPASYRWMSERTMGRLFMARLEDGPSIPFYPVDLAAWQVDHAAEAMPLLHQSARGSFPRRGYPMPLQQAHEHAHLSAFEITTLEQMSRMAPPTPIELYSPDPPIGVLKGFSPLPHQLEVEAIVPFAERGLPGFGEFLLIEKDPCQALVGRVTRYHMAGQLDSDQGDAYLADRAKTRQTVPMPIIQQMFRYSLKIHLLGDLRIENGSFRFQVGHRSFATLGSHVRAPSNAALTFLCNVGLENDPTAAPLGVLTYGQHVTSAPVMFSVARLKAKRNFVFARAGYGKSNLIKYLVSQLYTSPPDVGLLIFDPEGEYALPDAHGRPGLVNAPGLKNRVSLYTNRQVDPAFAPLCRGDAYVDFGDFPPKDIVAAFVPPDKQETVFANLLRSLDWESWKKVVQLLAEEGFRADNRQLASLLSYTPRQNDVSLEAIKNNLVPAIKRLHHAGASLGKNILEELRQTRVVVVDVSLLGSEDSLAIASMLLRRVFHHNVRHLTEIGGPSVRCLAVIEEAQTVLGDRYLNDANIFVRWVKEGRKYGLGAILVTQQPEALSDQIISQGDNFFVLQLLNDNDLQTLKRHNAYYTDEILNYLRAEPIVGNCYFWSAPSQPFVLPVLVENFETYAQMPSPSPAAVPSPVPNESALVAAVREVLEKDPRVWVYPVKAWNGDPSAHRLAFSADYLLNTVAQRVARPADEIKTEVPRLLSANGGKLGYALVEGVVRSVWDIPKSQIHVHRTKPLRPTALEINETF